MTVTARQLNRATLARQLLLCRERLSASEAVRRVVALQAQEPASPYVALWNRVRDFDASDLDAAFTGQTVVKATLMRVTLHAVHAGDYPWLHEAMQRTLRAARLNDGRFVSHRLTDTEADALIADVFAFTAQPRTNADVERWLADRLEVPEPRLWWALRQCGPFIHAVTGAPWSFGLRPSYVAAPPQQWPGNSPASMRWLVRRYLEAFGPASIPDIAQFGMLYRSDVRAALQSLGDSVQALEGPHGAQLFDVQGGSVPPEETPAPPRLMAMWDSTLLVYADRSRVIPPEYRRLVIRSNGDVLPTLLVDGYVCGVWRPVEGGIEATAFHRLSEEAWAGLAAEAGSLVGLLARRDPTVYRRYARWWAALAGAEVRLLSP